MFSIDKFNKIFLTKGDNAEILVRVFYEDKTEYILGEGDTLHLTIKKAQGGETILHKTSTSGTFLFVPADTNLLDAGLYVYDIQLSTHNERIYTIIPTSFFQLCGEVSV